MREKKGRSNHKDKVGDKVLVITTTHEHGGQLKEVKHKGPYEVIEVFNNGTVKIKCTNFKETIHIRRIRPFYERQKND